MTKTLLSGNEAVARGAWEADVRVVSAYPGTPSTEITENIVKYEGIYAEWAPNEKVALEVACGAAIAGGRAMACMKHVGLNVAADPLFTVSYTGVEAGLVVVVADDPGMHSSQNEQDSRFYARAAHVPMLEPADSQEALDFTRAAFELSEAYDTPVFVRMTTRISHASSVVAVHEKQDTPLKEFSRNVEKYVMMPAMARRRHPIVEARMDRLQKDLCASPFNRIEMRDQELGVVCSGAVYQYVRQVLPEASVFKLGAVYPLAIEAIRAFAGKVKKLYVIEELEPFIENQLRANGIDAVGKALFSRQGELSATAIARVFGREFESLEPQSVPVRPPVLCPSCPHRAVFAALKKLGVTVNGDIGCYTLGALPPLSAMHTCICMGASISSALGMEKARGQDFARSQVAVIGDSTFLHSGIAGLMDVVYNGGTTTVLILDNSTTGMTGHQQHAGTGRTIFNDPAPSVDLEALCRALGVVHVRTVSPMDTKALEAALREEIARPAPSVVIARHPCVLLTKDRKPPVRIDSENCRVCRQCMRIGCPAIEHKGDRIEINAALCNGCGLCTQVCPFKALSIDQGGMGA